jgi:tRNA(Ile)-lysidine synthase
MARSAVNCQEAAEVIHYQADKDLASCRGEYKHSLSIAQLVKFSPARQHQVIRLWIQQNGFALPDRNKVESICSDFISLRHDAQPVIGWNGCQLHRFSGYLYLLTPVNLIVPGDIEITPKMFESGSIDLPCPAGRLLIETNASRTDTLKYRVSFRGTGDSFRLLNRQGRRKLKKLFQAWHIPPWMRNHVPIIYCNDQCIAISDYAKCQTELTHSLEKITWLPDKAYAWIQSTDAPLNR